MVLFLSLIFCKQGDYCSSGAFQVAPASYYFQMLDLLFDYVDLSMTKLCPEKGKMEELEEYYMVCKQTWGYRCFITLYKVVLFLKHRYLI